MNRLQASGFRLPVRTAAWGLLLAFAAAAFAQDADPAAKQAAAEHAKAATAYETERKWIDAAGAWKKAYDAAPSADAALGEGRALLAFAEETLAAGDAGSSIRAAFEDARRALVRAKEKGADGVELALGLARCADGEGRKDEQIATLEDAMKRFGTDPRPRRALAFALLDAKREADALPHFKALSDADPKDDKLALCLSRCARVTGDEALAVSAAVRRIETDPNDRRGWEHVWAVYAPAKRWAEVAAQLEKLSAAHPESRHAPHYIGFAYSADAKWDEALAALGRAVASDPANIPARVEMGRILLDKKHDREKASQVLREAVTLAPENAKAVSVFSFLIGRRAEEADHAGAARDLEVLAKARPDDALVWANLALERRWNGEYEGAEQAYKKSLDLRPRDAQVWNDYGLLLIVIGRKDDAAAVFRRGIEADPLANDNIENLAFLARAAGREAETLDLFRQAESAAMRRGDAAMTGRHRRNMDDAAFPLPPVPVPPR